MRPALRLILSTSPPAQTGGKPPGLQALRCRKRLPSRGLRYRPVVKELDTETGLYYYGARYLDPKTSRWLSGDPAISEYIPSAPVNEEARKRNGNLPGMGGVFNYVNLHAYHYAGNNPVIYIDPDGRNPKNHSELTQGRFKAELLDIFGGSVKMGLGAQINLNLATLLKINAGIDLGSMESVQDKNGLNSTDTAGVHLAVEVLGFGEIGGEFSRTAPASDSDSFIDHVVNAWQNGETRAGVTASINVRGVGLTGDDNNDLKIEVGGQLGVGFRVWLNLTEAVDFLEYGLGLLRAIITQD